MVWGHKRKFGVVLFAAWTLWPAASVAAGPGFTVTQAWIDRAAHAADTARVLLKATIDTTHNGLDVAGLISHTARITVRAARGLEVVQPLTACISLGGGVRCRGPNYRLKLTRTPASSVYVLQLTLRWTGGGAAGTEQPRGPVRVSWTFQSGAELVDVISDCEASGSARLHCRDLHRPNIIFIVSDDQRWDTLQYMPHLLDQIASRGVTFSNAFVTTSSCAASRASMLTGLYARHHGVRTVGAPNGGATTFVGPDRTTLATWLHDVGYRTGLYGKYITDYTKQCPPLTTSCYIPPGWDEWHAFVQQHYYNYKLAENGAVHAFGSTPADYATDVLGAKAVDFILSADGQPFFLHVGFNAPHQEGNVQPEPAPRHIDSYSGIAPWRPPSYDEADISDKPPWFGLQPRANTALGATLLTHGFWGDFVRRRQIESLTAVDEAIDAMMSALDATGQAENTIVVFTSDNGHLWGEHRHFYGKGPPHEESIRVPLVMRFPRMIPAGGTDTRIALNIDVPVTLARLAGVVPPPNVDGRDLSPQFRDASLPGREDFVVELWGGPASADYATYAGIRTAEWKYVPYSTGDAELYDLVNDPYELDNRAHDPAYQEEVALLQARLDALLVSGQ